MSSQHTKPCNDCPWRRNAQQGWLGTEYSAIDWIRQVKGEGIILCHTKALTEDPDVEPRCAGAAIFRANICKVPRDRNELRLEADRENVFSNQDEFLIYHEEGLDED